jgi:uncharacterized membrane protein YfcA
MHDGVDEMYMLLGFVVGLIGAMVGSGGGFLVMPVLLLVGRMPPFQAAAVSLVMVTASATSGTLTFARQRQVDWQTGLLLAGVAVPGALLGARLSAHLPVTAFAPLFGLVVAGVGIGLALSPRIAVLQANSKEGWNRSLTTRHGQTYRYGVRVGRISLGMGLIGCLSALLGIGGGPLMVPLLVFAGSMPVHIAIATAQPIILLASVAGVIGYVSGGAVNWPIAVALSFGALVGAPLGAAISPFLPARRLLQLLGIGLLGVGIRLMFS